jgi:hypothetical protein
MVPLGSIIPPGWGIPQGFLGVGKKPFQDPDKAVGYMPEVPFGNGVDHQVTSGSQIQDP